MGNGINECYEIVTYKRRDIWIPRSRCVKSPGEICVTASACRIGSIVQAPLKLQLRNDKPIWNKQMSAPPGETPSEIVFVRIAPASPMITPYSPSLLHLSPLSPPSISPLPTHPTPSNPQQLPPNPQQPLQFSLRVLRSLHVERRRGCREGHFGIG